MLKPRGAICNLDCAYCFFLIKEELYPDGTFHMSLELLEEYTRQYIAAQPVDTVTFAWQGGEPALMGLDFFRTAVALQQKYRRPGMTIQNAFQTNGTLLDDEWGAFFREHRFLIGLSLDGPADLHDAYRRDKGGQATFKQVMRGLEVLQRHQVDFNILTCVHAANAPQPRRVYDFLRSQVGAEFIQFIPIVERENETGFQEGTRISRRSVSGPAYGRFLIEIFDEWVRNDIGQVYVQIFDVALAAWLGEPAGLCVFDETCGLGLALEHNGDLYACDHFVEPRYRLGNLQDTPLVDLAFHPSQVAFGRAKKENLPRYCLECPVRFVCNGGCPKNRFRRTPDGEEGLNYLCAGYRDFFRYIDEPMRLMAARLRLGGAPSDIIAHMRTRPSAVEQGLFDQLPAASKSRRRRARRNQE